MTEKGDEVYDVSVEVKSGIENGLEVKKVEVVEDVEVGLECNGKGGAHSDGSDNGVMVKRNDDVNSYVFVSEGDVTVEDGPNRGDNSEILVESILSYESKEDEAESLHEGPKPNDEEGGKTFCVVENGVSVFRTDGVDDSMGEANGDEKNMDMVEEIGKIDGESEPREVENDLQVENPVSVEYSNKLEDAQEAVNATPDDLESNSQQIINDEVENGDAVLELSDPREEELDSEIETTEPNESELIIEVMNRNSNEVYSVDKGENQESKDLMSSDEQPDSVELKQPDPINAFVDPLPDKVIDDKETQFGEEENKLENNSEHPSDVKENKKCESLVQNDPQLDFNKEEQNDSAKILLREPIDEASPNEHDDFPSRKITGAKGNEGNNIDSVSNLDEILNPVAASAVSTEVHLILPEQEEKALENETQMVANDNQTHEAEQTLSLNSVDQEQKELASDINNGQHSEPGTGCGDGHSPDRNGHDFLADDVDVIAPDADNGDRVVPTDNEWPELSFYNTKKKIITESNIYARISQESETISEEMHLAMTDRDGKKIHNIDTEDSIHVGHKKVLDASLSEDRSACPDSRSNEVINYIGQSNNTSLSENSEGACLDTGASEVINHIGQSTTGNGDNDQIDGLSTPVLCTCSQSLSDGVANAENLDSEVAISESRDNDDETNLNGNIEAPKVEKTLSVDEESSRTAVESEVDRRPFFFLVKVPRFEDDDIKEQIKFAQQELEEKTKLRDSFKVQIQTIKAICEEFDADLEAAKLEERVARDSLKAKRKEIDAAQAVIDKVNNAMTVEDIDANMHNMEHRMQHETIPLSEEKQLMREIKRLKHFKEQLSSSIGTQEELQNALDQKDHIKDHLKSLKRELDSIRNNVQKAETGTKAAKKKCFDKYSELNKLKVEHRAADGVCQKAHRSLVSLRRDLAQKNKFFWMYKDKEKAANYYASSGDREALHSLCVNQVEMVMELWNTDDEFRKDYVKCNAIRTLRRLKTLDGRSLGLDEEPPSLPYLRSDRFIHSQVVTNSLSQFPSLEQSKKHIPSIAEKPNEEPVLEVVDKKEAKKQSNSTTAVSEVLTVPNQELTEEEKEEIKRRKKEEELAKRAEEMRRKEEEVERMEQLRLEEKVKAKEALERKKRLAEKAQARAELRAKKEAEQREKEREKRLRKKEKRKSAGAKEEEYEKECMGVQETQAEVTRETKLTEKPLAVSKRHHKQPNVTKANSMPLPLRNRGRRKMHMWMWIGLSSLAAVALLWIGYRSSMA